MQFPPDRVDLLDAIAALLEDHVVAAVPQELGHRVRVAAHLARLLQRECVLGDALDQAEFERLGALGFGGADLSAARQALHDRLRDPAPFDHEDDSAIRRALMMTVIGDLSIAKPGYDQP
jgi:hypothetical protein